MGETAQTNLQLYNHLIASRWSTSDLQRVRDAYDLAARLFSARYRGSGKTFIAHAVGTADVVAAVDGRPELVLAGLLHAAYTVGDFGSARRAGEGERRRAVRDVIGDAAEQLVFDYAGTDWHAVGAVDACGRDLAVLRMANELEEHCDLGARYCDPSGAISNTADALRVMAALAERLERPQLAAALLDALEAERDVTLPAVLCTGTTASRRLPPRSTRRRPRVAFEQIVSRALRRVRGLRS